MGAPYSQSLELFSFHTVSKGFTGECGQRGGYVEFTNIHPEVMEQCYKIVSVSLSPNVTGQLMVSDSESDDLCLCFFRRDKGLSGPYQD